MVQKNEKVSTGEIRDHPSRKEDKNGCALYRFGLPSSVIMSSSVPVRMC